MGVYDLSGTFSSVSLPDGLDIFDVDDLAWARPADTAAVPLPASLPLLAGGALLLGLLRRRA